MTMVFTAKVKNGAIVVRNVPLPDGELVDVTIDPQEVEDGFALTEAERLGCEIGEAEAAAGLGRPVHELLAELRAEDAVRSKADALGRTRISSRKGKLGATRPRAKPAPKRSRARQ